MDIRKRLESFISEDQGSSGFQFGISFLEQRAEEYRKIKVDWLALKDGGVIDEAEYDFISKFDVLPWTEKSGFLQQNKDICGSIFMQLISKINKENKLSPLLVSIDEILERDSRNCELFLNYFSSDGGEIYNNSLFFLLSRDDKFQANLGSIILARIMSTLNKDIHFSELQKYFQWLFENIVQQNNQYIYSVCRCLQMMLKKDAYRMTFIGLGGLDVILPILAKSSDYQTQYQLIFCIWCLSYNKTFNQNIKLFNVLSILTNILGEAVKEKVSRVIIATLRNLLEKPTSEEVVKSNAIIMIKNNAIKYIDILSERKYDDVDIDDDIQFLKDKLEFYVQGFSSFDEYLTEVRSGQLEWGIVHKSTSFWYENASKLNANNHELLKMLIALLNSDDPEVVSIAAYDLGEYAKHWHLGKKVLEELGAKFKITSLLLKENQHPDVRSQTLICLQKIMVNNLHTFDMFINSKSISSVAKEAKNQRENIIPKENKPQAPTPPKSPKVVKEPKKNEHEMAALNEHNK